jgi:hypothetical protein
MSPYHTVVAGTRRSISFLLLWQRSAVWAGMEENGSSPLDSEDAGMPEALDQICRAGST